MLGKALCAATLAVFVVLPGLAQAQPATQLAILDLEPATLTGEASDGIWPSSDIRIAVPWRVEFINLAAAVSETASGNASLSLALQCDQPAQGAPVQVAVPVATDPAVTGTAEMLLDASNLVGFTRLDCVVSGVFTGATSQAADEAQSQFKIIFTASIEASAQVTSKLAAPQKMMTYPIQVVNNGDAPVRIVFDVPPSGSRRWSIIAPEPVELDPGQAGTAVVLVATPFHNGFNKDAKAFTVVPVAMPLDTPDVQAAGEPIVLNGQVRGWYIPGPSPALGLLAIAGLALLVRRRAD